MAESGNRKRATKSVCTVVRSHSFHRRLSSDRARQVSKKREQMLISFFFPATIREFAFSTLDKKIGAWLFVHHVSYVSHMSSKRKKRKQKRKGY